MTNLTAGESYTVNSTAKTATGGEIAMDNTWFNTTLSIVKTGNGSTTSDSSAQSLTIPARPATPSGTPVITTAGTDTTHTNLKMAATLEYKIVANGTSVTIADTGWTTGSSSGADVAVAATTDDVWVRVKQTGSAFKSDVYKALEDVTVWTVITLEQVTGVTLSDTGRATWTNLTNETGLVNYSVKLYKGSSSLGSAKISNAATGATGVSFLSEMRAEGVGSYTVDVTAIGNGTTYISGAASGLSAAQTVTQLPAPSAGVWSSNNATFNKLASETDVDKYMITITGSGTIGGISTADVAITGSNLSIPITAPAGGDIFEVKTVAKTTGLSLDSEMSQSSDRYIAFISGETAVTVAAPVAGAAPQTSASGTGYTGTITWNEPLTSGGKFASSTVYTATVVLTAGATHTFAAGATMAVSGATNVSGNTISANTAGNTLTSTATFAATATKAVAAIAIKTQPSNLTYTAGETLDVTGLVATVSYNDGTSEDVAREDFALHTPSAITMMYTGGSAAVHGDVLTVAAHNNKTITLTCNGQTAATNALTVNKVALTGAVSISGTNTIGQILTASYTAGNGTGTVGYQWQANGSNISGANAETYTLTGADVGKAITCKVTYSNQSGNVSGSFDSGKTVPYNFAVNSVGNSNGDDITWSLSSGRAGNAIAINYTLADDNIINTLTFSGGTGLAVVPSAVASASQNYTITPSDAVNGVITITATFLHTTLLPQTLTFVNGNQTKTFGSGTFTQTAIKSEPAATGAITYASSALGVATVNNTGLVALVGQGQATITASIAADGTHTGATASYTLTVTNALQAAPSGIGTSNETATGTNNGTITNVTTAMEYKKQGDASYIEITSTTVTGLAPGAYLVRYKAKANHNASADVTVTIAAYSVSTACTVTAISAPSAATISGTGITASVENSVSSQPIALTTSPKASWKLYSDVGCTNEIATKTMTLAVGSNTAYVKVTAEDGSSTKTYTLTLTRKAAQATPTPVPEPTPTAAIPTSSSSSRAQSGAASSNSGNSSSGSSAGSSSASASSSSPISSSSNSPKPGAAPTPAEISQNPPKPSLGESFSVTAPEGSLSWDDAMLEGVYDDTNSAYTFTPLQAGETEIAYTDENGLETIITVSIADEVAPLANGKNKNGFPWWILILTGILACGAFIVIVLVRRRKKEDS